ncbi:hypothetical protein [Streptomyces corynorhini]|nr:hypothetical protein [Streptomyces corynorhini]
MTRAPRRPYDVQKRVMVALLTAGLTILACSAALAAVVIALALRAA